MRVDVEALLRGLRINATDEQTKWRAPCPSNRHRDRHPSWTMVDQPGHEKHGLHECRSCHFKGTSFDLVAHVLDIGNYSAVEWIIGNAYGQLNAVPDVVIKVQQSFFRRGCKLPPEVVFEPMSIWPGPVRDYAVSRGITPLQVERWGIGYALEGRLAGRIVIVSHNRDRVPLDYTARTFWPSPHKYLAAVEAENPSPGAIFGERYWPPMAHRDLVVVLEGGINGLAVERASNLPFGCVSGSEVQLEHLMKFSTFRRAIILTDPDPAGDRAAELLEASLLRHLGVARLRLPEGSDAQTVQSQYLHDELSALADGVVAGGL
jgi:5S rRNA maturation endonuclease (ribonuclease M5)